MGEKKKSSFQQKVLNDLSQHEIVPKKYEHLLSWTMLLKFLKWQKTSWNADNFNLSCTVYTHSHLLYILENLQFVQEKLKRKHCHITIPVSGGLQFWVPFLFVLRASFDPIDELPCNNMSLSDVIIHRCDLEIMWGFPVWNKSWMSWNKIKSIYISF